MGEHSKPEVAKPSRKPVKKVTAATAAGAAFVLATYVAAKFGYQLDPEVKDSLAVLLVFGAGYLKKA